MRSRGVVGKKIARVVQHRVPAEVGRHGGLYAVVYIELEDGTRLTPSVHEREDYYAVDLLVSKP